MVDLNSKNPISGCFSFLQKKNFADFSLKTQKTGLNGQISSKWPDFCTEMIALEFYIKWH